MKTTDDEFLTFRATFQFPKLDETQLKIRISSPIEVEVYREEDRRLWRAREPKSKALYKVTAPGSIDARRQVEALFEKQLSDWRPYSYGTPVDELPAETAHRRGIKV